MLSLEPTFLVNPPDMTIHDSTHNDITSQSAMNHHVYVVADIGGTNARFAYVSSLNHQLQGIEYLSCADFASLLDAFNHYMAQRQLTQVDHYCLAVPGPVEQDWIELPNNPWAFSRSQLQSHLQVPVEVINDFTAQTLSIDFLTEDELYWIGSQRPPGARKVKAMLGPGTGLGVAAMMPKGEVVPSEAGHVAFAPTNKHEVLLLQTLWQRHERISVERLLSGMGLSNLYWANAQLQGVQRELSAPEITKGAANGDALCLKAITDFYAILAAVAGDVALMMGAAGGLYLSGGILPKIRNFLQVELFRRYFENKGRLGSFCANIPIALVLAEHPGLVGCVQAIKQHYNVD